MSAFETLDYSSCFDAMRRAGLPFSPSEAHAIAIGLLSGAVADRDVQWQNAVYAELDPNDALATECRAVLDDVYAAAREQMRDEAFGLQLFVPDEGFAGVPCTSALRDWAQGFLYGFGLAGKRAAQRLSVEGREALQDFYEIARLEVDAGDPAEDEQQALTEIEEYMRVAAMLVYEDMHAPADREGGHELH
jgi:uncharacterized protein YgfB (UPF0149 family)